MATPVLSKVEQNFIRFVKICIDVLKLPLADILASEIQPADLYNKMQHSCLLLNGINPRQRSICFLKPPAIPDYKQFDVTLLYKLIRNLCSSLKPTKGWGKDPVDADIQIGDDIERLRIFRNINVHNGSSEISDSDFETNLKKLKSALQRIQSHMASKGCNVNYEEKMTDIKQLDLGDELIDKYKVAYIVECVFCREQANDIEEPMISIEGPSNVLCGNTAKFYAIMSPENLKGWSITWQKIKERTHIRINSSTEKYFGSTDKNLVIQSVCKKDEGEYQAILSRDSKGKNISVSSNVIFLQTIGELPIFDLWDVTTGMEGITIHYSVKKMLPYVNEIKWTKDGVPISTRNTKYNGGELNDNHITITSPTIEDKGKYSCVVKNAVGSVQKDVQFDVPYAEISTEQQIRFGSKTSFTPRIASCPSLSGVEWQHSNDRRTFNSVDIRQPKYYGSSNNPKSPLLIIPKVTFEDKHFYRLLVWNRIGKQYSNTVLLNVKGSLPNITVSNSTCISNRSVTLIGNVFLYENLPALQNVFWTKNGEKLDAQGSGGRYTDVTVDNPSLTISEVNEYDAGSYQLTANNAVGSTTSDFLILDVPDVSMARPEKKNGRFWFNVTIQSIPAPDFVQWSYKEKSGNAFIPIDEHVEEFKGTSNTLPHPVLVVNPKNELKNYCFQIEVRNFIGSCKKLTPGEEASCDDSFRNDNQRGCLSEFYLDGGVGLKFAKLFDDIAEHFPEEKTRRLKDFIRHSHKVKDMTLFAQTVSARDCLEILCDQKLFTPLDVIFIQYLLKNTECMELFEKCVSYAEAHGALCFYEKIAENGYRNVQIHVKANLSCYTTFEITKIRQTVAAIVGCNSKEIAVNGYQHSASFLAVLSIKETHVKKLLTMKQQEKTRLSKLNIDYFIVDFITVYLQSSKETRRMENNDDYPIMLQNLRKRSKYDRKEWGEKQLHLSVLPRTYVLPKGESACGSALIEKKIKGLDQDISDIYNAIQTASIRVSAKEVKHISCLIPNKFWVSDMKKVQEIDENGRILRELNMYSTLFGSHALTKSGDLLFLKDNDVYILTSYGEIRNLFIHKSVHFCIHCSRMNGDILIGDINIVRRYNSLGMKRNQIEFDNIGQPLFVETIFITENTNRDIIVSDNGRKAVVAIDKLGLHLFNYEGHNSKTTFHPGGICTDAFGNILVCNVSSEPNVHLLDQRGQFLTYLLTKQQHGSDCPQALYVDNEHNLYVGYSNKSKINVYSYLTKEKLRDSYKKKIDANTEMESAIPPIPPREKFVRIDKCHAEQSSEKSDSEYRRKSYSDSTVAHATKLDEQTNSSKKLPFIRSSFSSIARRKNMDFAGSRYDDCDPEPYYGPSAAFFEKQKEWSRNMNKEPNFFFTKERLLYCDKHFEKENVKKSFPAPPIPHMSNSSTVQPCDSVIKMNLSDSDEDNESTLQQKPQESDLASFKDKRNELSNKEKTVPPIPPRSKLTMVQPCGTAEKLKQFVSVDENMSILRKKSTAFQLTTKKDPTEIHYDKKEPAPPIPPRSKLTMVQPCDTAAKLKQFDSDDENVYILTQQSTANRKFAIMKDPKEVHYMTTMAPPLPPKTKSTTCSFQPCDTAAKVKQFDSSDDERMSILRQESAAFQSATMKDPTELHYEMKETAPPIPTRSIIQNTQLLDSATKVNYSDSDEENVHTLQQKAQTYQLKPTGDSAGVYYYVMITDIKKDPMSSKDGESDLRERETMPTLHKKPRTFQHSFFYNTQEHIEEINRTGKIYIEVPFHRKQGLLRVSRLMMRAMTVDTVCAIVGCHSTDIIGNYYDDSNNSVNVIIDEIFLKYLLSLTNEDKDKLKKLEIDYFNIDFITVFLEPPKVIGDELCHFTNMTEEKTAQRSNNENVNLTEDKKFKFSLSPKPSAISTKTKPILALKGVLFQDDVKQTTSDVTSSKAVRKSAIHKKRIAVFTNGVKHISCLKSNKIWVSDFDKIEAIDEDGQTIMKLDVGFGVYGRHTVTRDGNLLFLMNYSVFILKSNGELRNLHINASKKSCIHASRSNSEFFIVSSNGVNKYSVRGRRLLIKQVDEKGENLYDRPIYITENTNGDIIVSDEQRKAIIAVDKIGRHRFNYTGNHSSPEFNPRGICTDTFGHILVCNHSYHDPSVHLLDQNGHFLMSLLTKHRSDEDLPQDVCVDDKHNLYVGCGINDVIDVYKYLA